MESLFPRYNSPILGDEYVEEINSTKECFGLLDLGHIISKWELVPDLRQNLSELGGYSPETVDHLMWGYELMQQFM